MTLHTDLPTHAQIELLLTSRDPASVSIYLPTTRVALGAHPDRTVLFNLGRTAAGQLAAGGVSPGEVAAIRGGINDVVDDDEFWNRQADSLAVFATPTAVKTFRLANQLTETVQVSDRFHVKPLFRAITFPHAAYVLALAKGEVRLLEIGASGPPQDVRIPELPRDAWDPQGNKIFKAREGTYVRQVDHALRAVLNGSDLPLILAATETIAALYRTVNTYPHLLPTRWPGNPEEMTDPDLADAVRPMLDDYYAAQISDIADLFAQRQPQGRTALDISDIARFATIGAVDTVVVDIDAAVPGTIDEGGAVSYAAAAGVDSYGVIDEITRRVYLAGGRVLAVRRPDIPGGGPAAAILRYPAR